jgi:hypothetical protein
MLRLAELQRDGVGPHVFICAKHIDIWLPGHYVHHEYVLSARLRLPVSSHGLSKASLLERELVIATVSGSTTPVEIRKIAQLASRYEW